MHNLKSEGNSKEKKNQSLKCNLEEGGQGES